MKRRDRVVLDNPIDEILRIFRERGKELYQDYGVKSALNSIDFFKSVIYIDTTCPSYWIGYDGIGVLILEEECNKVIKQYNKSHNSHLKPITIKFQEIFSEPFMS